MRGIPGIAPTAVMTLARDTVDALLAIAADALSAFEALLETELNARQPGASRISLVISSGCDIGET